MVWKLDESDTKPGIYISGIEFGDGSTLPNISKNDIVVFVGANNVGKSQTLKDIYWGLSNNRFVVLNCIDAVKCTKSYESLVKKIGTFGAYNTNSYDVMDHVINLNDIEWRLSLQCTDNDQLRDLFVCDLNTEIRLSTCQPAPRINRDENRSNPIHYVAFEYPIREKLTDYFFQAFSKYIYPNILYGNDIPLFVLNNPIHLGGQNFNDDTEHFEKYADELSKNPQVQNQGDGIKSFVGILLYLMLDFYRVYLIDEPEAFLHPPQAKVMGQMIGKLCSEDKQVFISTHSEHLIQGLLETAPDRVKIVRITREGNTNHAFILDTNDIEKFWSDPILKYSNIMEGLFYKNVVLCESDSDCRFYSIINDFMQREKGKYPETSFIPSGGKQRIPVIMKALTSLGVDTKVIADFDVLNNKDVFKKVCESCSINWDLINKDYSDFYDEIGRQNGLSKMPKQAFLSLVQRMEKEKINEQYFSDEEVGQLKEALKGKSFWNILKTSGINALPAGQASRLFGEINEIAKEHQLFIVPVGELECFVKAVSGHGPSWVSRVLEEYPDLDNSVYDAVKKFIGLLDL